MKISDTYEARIKQHEDKIERQLFYVYALCLIALISSPVLTYCDLKPTSEPVSVWFQRTGGIMTIFAFLAQVRAASILEMTRGSTFVSSWRSHYKYGSSQRTVSVLSSALVILGAVIWAYGDLLLGRFN